MALENGQPSVRLRHQNPPPVLGHKDIIFCDGLNAHTVSEIPSSRSSRLNCGEDLTQSLHRGLFTAESYALLELCASLEGDDPELAVFGITGDALL